jgi:transcriptional regulator GlxA family with amidase domain
MRGRNRGTCHPHVRLGCVNQSLVLPFSMARPNGPFHLDADAFREACMPDDYRIRKILESLEDDPAKSVRELANLVNLSSSRLGHLFKLQMGVDLSHFLANERLQKAAELLRQTELSIKEIAIRVGYHHSSSFDRGFQNKFGVPPANFRKRNRL